MAREKISRAEMNVIVVYVTQMEGRPTVDEIHETISKRMEVKASNRETRDAVLATKKRGLISVNYDYDKNEQMIERYSIKDVRFANPPEIAHIKAVLPKLLATKEAKAIQQILEDLHEEGARKGRLPDIRGYVTKEFEFEALTPILGGEPSVDNKCVLRRLNGSVWIPGNLWFRAALRIELRMKDVSVAKVKYLKFSDVFIPTKGLKTIEEARPVEGRGITIHEGLPFGTTFKIKCSFPTIGFMSEDDFISCMGNGIRIGAKHKEYGLLKLAEVA